MKFQIHLNKMHTIHSEKVGYELRDEDQILTFTDYIGKKVRLSYEGVIHCVNCGKKTKKSFNQGFCFPCTIKLAACDLCIVRPELCHFEKGTCREPSWGEENCLKPHVVYLANSSGLKVGITRRTQVPYRWIDQGATQALPIIEVTKRLDSGLIENHFKKHIADKTDWRKMLKGSADSLDLKSIRDDLLPKVLPEISNIDFKLLDENVFEFNYPVLKYPEKISSFNLDKANMVEGTLMGIKGQYLIFDSGVLNVRSHGGYQVCIEVLE